MESSQGRPVVAEVGMVVVPEVTRETIKRVIEILFEDGYFEDPAGTLDALELKKSSAVE